ncbi:MAG: nucleotidyltransferase domain-containing protein [Streptosporangiaceae bacterium]
MNVLLAGIVGSRAYGLAGPGSDVDRLGLFAAPTTAFHGLHGPAESIVTTEPDLTLHEAGKWCRLALAGNPTVMELVWLPAELYETRSDLGWELIGIRRAFLSGPGVRKSYLGYATQQFKKIAAGSFEPQSRRRGAKHARHLARLIAQGTGLYETGELRIRLHDPQWYLDFGEEVASGNLDRARALLARAEDDFSRDSAALPDRPDEETVEEWLLAVRAAHL